MANQTPPRRIPSPFPQFLTYSRRSPRGEVGWRPPGEPRCSQPPCLGKLKLFPFLLPLLLLLLLREAGPVIGSASGGDQTWDGVVVTQADFQALQSFKQELVDPRGFLRTWNDTGYGACSGGWDGIKCAQGQVIVIQLPWMGLAGRISAQIGQLRALRKLSLHDNLIGGSIPATVGLLPGLRGLQLFNNRLSGSVPPSLGFCRLLQTLDLSNNSLTGAIPGDLANATKLFLLNLSHNSFSGSIPAGLARSSLVFLALHHNNISGPMPAELGNLSSLRTLDLSNNRINGSLPVALSNLSSLVVLDLESNGLSNRIPENIDGLRSLSVLNLRGNNFDAGIPTAFGRMPALQQLDLSRNNLTGGIPPAIGDLPKLKSFSVSYNSLSGSVPVRLARQFNSSSFVGNIQLCGYSGSAPCPPPSSGAHAPAAARSIKPRRRKFSTKDMILISAGTILLVLLLLCCALLYCLIRRRISASRADDVRADTASTSSVVAGASGAGSIGKGGISSAAAGAAETSGSEAAGGMLVHFEGPTVFTAEELLCATAEIMGKSTYGTVYKATLEGGHQVAVKRLREKITKNEREFEVEVEQLGKIRHPNLLALRAYYAGPKGEKLLVFDFMPRGSLAAFLHARGSDTPMDWRMRKNIARAAARGLLHLHTNENIVHGNLTSGNVLLDDQTDARVSDFGLSRLMTAAANVNVIATASALGYRAPELSKLRKASAKTDVYSLGVLLLELLTGKSPGGEAMNGVDLPQWVASVVEEEWTNEVFDVELMREATDIGDELLNALKLALHCVDPSPSARPEVHLVLQQLEETEPEVTGSSGDDGSGAGPSTVE